MVEKQLGTTVDVERGLFLTPPTWYVAEDGHAVRGVNGGVKATQVEHAANAACRERDDADQLLSRQLA